MSTSFMYAMAEAVNRSQESQQKQQITDSITVENDVNLQTTINTYYNGPGGVLAQDANNVTYWATPNNATSGPTGGWDPNNTSYSSAQVTACQQKYNADAAMAQSITSRADTTTQTAQGQTSNDSSNIAQLAPLMQAITSAQSAVNNMPSVLQ